MRVGALIAAAAFTFAFVSGAAAAAFPAPHEADWIVRDFRFHTGQVLPELRLHYTTIGDPKGEPVLVLHGTGGSGSSMLSAAFAGELFGPGQPLDASRYYIIIPDAIGHGRSSKPSEGLRARFPEYDYDDMVAAQHRLLTEGLGVRHVRLVIGNSMGGMHAWVWGEAYPDFMDALVPMASQPAAMSGRNWMLRRMLIDSIRQDPAWKRGEYTVQPPNLKFASVFYNIATNGGELAWQEAAPTRAKADVIVDQREAAAFNGDANDTLYQWAASRDYDPTPGLNRITAPVLAINSADDERNPPATGVMERQMEQIRDARLYLIPTGPETRGHGTTANARLYAEPLRVFLDSVAHRPTR